MHSGFYTVILTTDLSDNKKKLNKKTDIFGTAGDPAVHRCFMREVEKVGYRREFNLYLYMQR